jgi:hypothetical protein
MPRAGLRSGGAIVDETKPAPTGKRVKRAPAQLDQEEHPSCYVVDVSILPGGMRRWDQLVFDSREQFERWLQLEFTHPLGLMTLLSYGKAYFYKVALLKTSLET